MNNIFDVSGKIVLITGSSRGIGYTLAKGFAESGATVIINGQTQNNLEKALDELKIITPNIHAFQFDISESSAVKKNIALIEKEIGAIDILVNNAGIHRRALLSEMSEADWKKVIDVNLTGVFIVSKAVSKNMIKRKKGKIINITSLNAEGARPTIANYCAAKSGLKMLTKSMATEWGKYNIQANAIGPGYFKTDMTEKLVNDPEFDAWVKQEVTLGRWGKPEELIGTAIFLASEASSYITGITIYVDGGWQASL